MFCFPGLEKLVTLYLEDEITRKKLGESNLAELFAERYDESQRIISSRIFSCACTISSLQLGNEYGPGERYVRARDRLEKRSRQRKKQVKQ